MRFPILCLSVLSLIGVGISPGCSKQEMNEIAEQVQERGEQIVVEGKKVVVRGKEAVIDSKKVTDSIVRGPAEAVVPTGHLRIETTPPMEFDFALVKMHVVGDGRPNSLQISSYDPEAGTPDAPAVFLHATTSTETVALAAGKPMPCNLFLEQSTGGAIARTPIDQPVIVHFGAMNMQERSITATIEPCTLIASDGSAIEISGGQLLGVVSGN